MRRLFPFGFLARSSCPSTTDAACSVGISLSLHAAGGDDDGGMAARSATSASGMGAPMRALGHGGGTREARRELLRACPPAPDDPVTLLRRSCKTGSHYQQSPSLLSPGTRVDRCATDCQQQSWQSVTEKKDGGQVARLSQCSFTNAEKGS